MFAVNKEDVNTQVTPDKPVLHASMTEGGELSINDQMNPKENKPLDLSERSGQDETMDIKENEVKVQSPNMSPEIIGIVEEMKVPAYSIPKEVTKMEKARNYNQS